MVSMSILSGEMTTGQRLAAVPASAGSFTTSLNGTGEITCSIPLRDQRIAARAPGLLAALEPWRTFLAYLADDAIVEAGPVVGHDYGDDQGVLEVKALGLRGLLARRLVIDATAADPASSVLSYTNLSLGTIAKRLVQRTLANPGGRLPIVLPADEAGINERNYPGHEAATVAQRLDDLTGVQNGPDIAFEPRFTADGLGVEWVMRHGSAAHPLIVQTGDDWVWDATVRGAVAGLSLARDASSRTNSVYATGQGMDEATMMSRATAPEQWDNGYPLLEDAYSHSTVSVQATLDAWADAYLSQGLMPWTTWSLEVAADDYPKLGQYRPGDWVAVHTDAHPYLGSGIYRSRIASFSGGLDDPTVSLQLRPTLDLR